MIRTLTTSSADLSSVKKHKNSTTRCSAVTTVKQEPNHFVFKAGKSAFNPGETVSGVAQLNADPAANPLSLQSRAVIIWNYTVFIQPCIGSMTPTAARVEWKIVPPKKQEFVKIRQKYLSTYLLYDSPWGFYDALKLRWTQLPAGKITHPPDAAVGLGQKNWINLKEIRARWRTFFGHLPSSYESNRKCRQKLAN